MVRCRIAEDTYARADQRAARAGLAGAAWLALASERAEEQSRGPASFRTALVDALWTVRGDEIAEYLNL